ncbi:class D beta-lactamase [Phyllobacterium zundukense]|uniref:Class D beta-lactamase n=1 Tax=Phyllobacterium zundukense TaxID=1867719 RepID=A0ACD4CW32_9HYPH|nr:class D beta-lactamase [Phyllobacterium zundukense]UXN57791.1 class D beta-lactamase [Phyllobacterium zundukense]
MSIHVINKAFGFPALILSILVSISSAAYAEECTFVVDAQTGATVEEKGACDDRYTAASTFKVALALMGYDAGVLTDAHTPLWNWQEGIRAPTRDKKPVDPIIWQADSVLWYSRELARHVGAQRFSSYVGKFNYGNMDVSGEPGKSNGLSHAWITSLTISPREQTDFIRRMLAHELPVSPAAINKTMAIVPTFNTESGWRVHGKTGSGWTRDTRGKIQRSRPEGWFVGWAERQGRVIVFARLGIGTVEGRQGLIEQENLLSALENL